MVVTAINLLRPHRAILRIPWKTICLLLYARTPALDICAQVNIGIILVSVARKDIAFPSSQVRRVQASVAARALHGPKIVISTTARRRSPSGMSRRAAPWRIRRGGAPTATGAASPASCSRRGPRVRRSCRGTLALRGAVGDTVDGGAATGGGNSMRRLSDARLAARGAGRACGGRETGGSAPVAGTRSAGALFWRVRIIRVTHSSRGIPTSRTNSSSCSSDMRSRSRATGSAAATRAPDPQSPPASWSRPGCSACGNSP